MRPILIAGNWKMNGSLESVVELIEGIRAGSGGTCALRIEQISVEIADLAGHPQSL